MTDSKNDARLAELKAIAAENGGILIPEKVVEFAERKTSALHDAFEWDDTEAARKYRIEQARAIIRVSVEIIDTGAGKESMSAWVSLRSERFENAPGYRHVPTLMRTKEGRDSILATALWELQAFETKYAKLKELAGVFAAVRRVRRQTRGKAK